MDTSKSITRTRSNAFDEGLRVKSQALSFDDNSSWIIHHLSLNKNPDRDRADKAENRMTGEGMSEDQKLIELTTLALQRYRLLADRSKALEGAQRLLFYPRWNTGGHPRVS